MRILFTLLISLLCVLPTGAQNFRSEWKKVEAAIEKDMPRTVIAESENIIRQAQRLGDTAELLRATLVWMSYRSAISGDSLQVDMKKMRQQAESCVDLVDKCLLNLILAVNEQDVEQQKSRYQQALGIQVPDSQAIFEALTLKKTTEYTSLIKAGSASDAFDHDMLSFMRQAAVSAMPYQLQRTLGKRLFERDEAYYRQKGNNSAAYLVALEGVHSQAGVYPSLNNLSSRYHALPDFQLDSINEIPSHLHEKDLIAAFQQWITQNPRHTRVNFARQQLEYLKTPRLSVSQASKEVYPEESMSFRLNSYHIQQMEVCWYELPNPSQVEIYQEMSSEKLRKMGKLVKRQNVQLTKEWYAHTDSLVVVQAPSQMGLYRFEIHPVNCGDYPISKVKVSAELVCVTQLMTITIPQNTQKTEIWVVDRFSGKPLSGVDVALYEQKNRSYQETKRFTTDEQGLVQLDKLAYSTKIQLCKGQDLTLLTNQSTRFSSTSEKKGKLTYHNLYSDRSIYRPGQRVSYSLLSYRMQEDHVMAAENDTVQVTLRGNGSSKQIYTTQLITNQWGMATDSFQLPENLESGTYQLRTPHTQCVIRVEEYKRPNFHVDWKSVDGLYQLGDTLQLQGIASQYSGAPVQQAQVRLITTIQQQQWWRVLTEEQVQVDTLATDTQGLFTCHLPLTLPTSMTSVDTGLGTYYRFTVQAVVTSQDGETHEMMKSVLVGKKPFALSLDYAELVCKESLAHWTIHLYNASFTSVSQLVDIQIWNAENQQVVWQGTQLAGIAFEPTFVQSLPSGKYITRLTYAGEQTEYSWSLFSMEDNTPLPGADLWLYAPSENMDEHTPISLQLGTSFMDAHLAVHIYNGQGKIQTQTYTLSNQLKVLTIPYQPSWGKGVRVVTWMVYHGQVYRRDVTFKKTVPEKQLKVVWHSFRDLLQPGQHETWNLTFLHPNGTPAQVNLLATMYDASLDALTKQSWHFNLPFQRYIPQISRISASSQFYYGLEFPNLHNHSVRYPEYDTWQDGVSLQVGRKFTRMYKMATVMNAPAEMDMVEAASVMSVATNQSSAETTSVQFRSDFRETAFFYPSLRSNAQGELSIQFTMPESLTEWKMMGLAHTPTMDYALIDKTIQVRKPLMVKTNTPRFLRVGDHVDLRVSVQNLSEKEQLGFVYLVLTDSTLQKKVATYQRPIQLNPGTTATYSFSYSVADLGPSIVCQVYAKTDDFSDGEQQLLPIISNLVQLTETRAVYLTEKKQTIDLSDMLNAGKGWNESSSMVVETIHNPLWLIMETLGLEQNPKSENAVDLASAYYAASIGAYLQQKYPTIAEVRTHQKKEDIAAQWLRQLEKLQLANGSFAWFEGMSGSPRITRQVVELFLRLRKMNVPVLDVQRYESLITKSLEYLDADAVKVVESRKKWEKSTNQKWVPDESALHYMYLQVLCPRTLSAQGKQALDFMVDRLSLVKGDNLYNKALACVVAAGLGKRDMAKQILQSLLEYSVCTSEMGRYFDSNLSMVSWRNYRIPTQTLLIEALDAVQPTNQDPARKQLCQWLINQRRTQQWENSAAVMDIMYALLLSPAADMKITQSDKMYEKQAVSAAVQKQMPKTWSVQRVESSDSPMSWVSVSMHTLQPLSQIKEDGKHSGLHVTRTFWVDGLPVDTIQIGQKVICKIHLSVDRDMDFVQLKLEKPSCLESVSSLSGYRWGQGLGYFYAPKDQSVLFYIDRLAKGTYEIQSEFYVTHAGTYHSGLATIQGVYCPEFADHTESVQLIVK